MKKKIYMILLVAVLCITGIGGTVYTVNNTTTSEDYIPSETIQPTESPIIPLIQRVETKDKESLQKLIRECIERKESAHAMADAARNLDYTEEDRIIKIAVAEWNSANENQKYYQSVLNEIIAEEEAAAIQAKWEARYAEYPVATEAWLLLKDYGLNDYVCAGIMGNMMAEAAGQTLALHSDADNGSHYGLCQWSKYYYPSVCGEDVEGQVAFLMSNIKKELDTYGFVYQSGFDYEDFYNMNDEKQVAIAFAKCYERCGNNSYYVRANNATVALEYFTK